MFADKFKDKLAQIKKTTNSIATDIIETVKIDEETRNTRLDLCVKSVVALFRLKLG
jgi:hypothetical protein